MYTQVGSCPKCGSPIYVPTIWQGITPPPSTPSCMCNYNPQQITTTTHTKESLH